jgi:hypothetical protein
VRKILQFQQPLAYGYQFYAFPLGILATRPKATDWVLSNYVQVVYEYSGEAAPVPFAFYVYDYSVSPWLETLRMNREWCGLQEKGIAGIVRDAISQDFYVYLTLNERYVPDRRAYGGTVDSAHDCLIRGVDDEAGTYEIFGYDRNQVFRGTQLPTADLPRAYNEIGPAGFYDVPLTLYRYHDSGEYTFDLGYIARGVGEYLDSVNTSMHFQAQRDPWYRAYGMETYDLLASYLDEYARGRLGFNICHLQVLWEHKRLMVARLVRCAELVPSVTELVAPYQQIQRRAWKLRMLMIAHGAGRAVGDFGSEAVALLDAIRTAERPLLEKFAAALATEVCSGRTSARGSALAVGGRALKRDRGVGPRRRPGSDW